MRRRAFLHATAMAGAIDPIPNGRPSGFRTESTGSFDGFEDLSQWRALDGSLSADPDIHDTGSQSARLDIGADDDRGRIARSFDPPIDLSGTRAGLVVRSTRNVYPRIQLFDADRDRIDFRTSVRGELPFRRYDFGVDAVVGDPDLSSVSEIRLVQYTGADPACTIWCDDLRLVSESETGTVLLQFDDGNVTDYTEAYPVLEEYGYSATSFVNPGTVGTDSHLSVEQLRALRDAGWTVGSHAYDHVSLPDLDEGAQRAQIRRAKEWLLDRGFERGAEYFAYPYADYDETTLAVVDEHHTLGFAGGYPAAGPVEQPRLCHRTSDPTAEEARRAIDLAAEWNGTTTLFFHYLDEEARREFEATVEYLHDRETAGAIAVATPSSLVSTREPSVTAYAGDDGTVGVAGVRDAIDDWAAGDVDTALLREVFGAARRGASVA